MTRARTVAIGIGDEMRGDDGVGAYVARLLEERRPAGLAIRRHRGDALSLIEAWAKADHVILVDAAQTGAPPGTIHVLNADTEPLPDALARCSSHGFGLGEALDLARTLGRMPARLTLYAVEATDFTPGAPMTPAVAEAAHALAATIGEEVT